MVLWPLRIRRGDGPKKIGLPSIGIVQCAKNAIDTFDPAETGSEPASKTRIEARLANMWNRFRHGEKLIWLDLLRLDVYILAKRSIESHYFPSKLFGKDTGGQSVLSESNG